MKKEVAKMWIFFEIFEGNVAKMWIFFEIFEKTCIFILYYNSKHFVYY